jgi:hypothetical protein
MEFQGEDTERTFVERDFEQNRSDHLRDSYYLVRLGPMDFDPGTASLTTVSSMPAILYSVGSDKIIRFSFPKPIYWRSGTVKAHLVWGTNGTSTSDVYLDSLIVGQSLGVAVASGQTTLYNAQLNLTPDGTANNSYYTTWLGTGDITDDHKIVWGSLNRDETNDPNNNGFFIFGFAIQFIPTKRQ